MVIPARLRKSMKLHEGERFIVAGLGDIIILRRVQLSRERLRLKRLIRESSEKAKKSGFTGREVEKLIEKTRKTSE